MLQDGTARIVISGAGQGIGRALARHFASKGHKIFVLDVNEDNIKHTAEVHLKEYFETNNVGWAVCDLRSVDSIRQTVRSKAAVFLDNHIDFLVNNAGISNPYWGDGKTMEDESVLEQWQAYVETNLTGTFVMSQACLPYMKVDRQEDKQKLPGSKVGTVGPCIIHISSFRALISDPNQEGYASTKAALLGLTQSMAVSMQSLGIRVNQVSPGRIKATHEHREGEEKGRAEWGMGEDDVKDHPTNRAGVPEDIAEAVEYLLGAGFVTGQDLVVDGGVGKVK
ncbi:uncharacterized protein A1O9_07134 [Exophiala aquamarina CBS 119918]|uniref:3-oxoacyl-[acyl-carrier protein] reductase n=1 Tax=Exophiala aquamarina CBS 119918 TaxID=1182545 RepID=A0A072PA08_9EURO|nr:uncharacterized protein A1O9_07134 [Exophiala aquamarina CBS 119918]KEF56944.1 hypothetical protein A1O9_07134 [Exophiala aquamarina CBS 119918]